MHPWIAHRTEAFDSSGIRRIFDLAAKLKDPINLSIGQPDFDVPTEVKGAIIEAIETGKNAYSPPIPRIPIATCLSVAVPAAD
jgi:aspartate/methionine/tyrosine aminotransferase